MALVLPPCEEMSVRMAVHYSQSVISLDYLMVCDLRKPNKFQTQVKYSYVLLMIYSVGVRFEEGFMFGCYIKPTHLNVFISVKTKLFQATAKEMKKKISASRHR